MSLMKEDDTMMYVLVLSVARSTMAFILFKSDLLSLKSRVGWSPMVTIVPPVRV